MNERTIFTEALERGTPAERSAFLDAACGGDTALRARVETLLRAHDEAGTFLGKPVIERFDDALTPRDPADKQTVPAAEGDDPSLDFLEPSDRPGVLGRLGHYEIVEVVGRGGMGVVLRAADERLHRVVAIKVMAAELATSGTARKRFAREAQAAAAVSHDHVVTIHGVEESGRLPYIVMQYVAGLSLQERLDRDGPLALREVLRIGMQTAAGLAAAHAQGLVHRDVKPSNILLENGVERVKLTDFGLARAADDASLTQSGIIAGTPAYMSPEQAEGGAVDQRSDLFSLGSVLYAMCTGRPPFCAGSGIAVLRRVCEGTPPPIRESNPEVPEWLVAIVEKLHAKDPAARFQSATEVAEMLGGHLAHIQHRAVACPDRPPLPPPVRRKRWAAPAAILAVLVAGLGAAEIAGVTRLRVRLSRLFLPAGTVAGGVREVVARRSATPPVPARPAAGSWVGAPFVIGARAGREERPFATLAEAVAAARGGDTIEIRGNGPFVCAPVNIDRIALTIRAGDGFRPVLRVERGTPQSVNYLFWHNRRLVLEGLELQHLADVAPADFAKIITSSGPLHLVHCRLVLKGMGMGVAGSGQLREFRNGEFVGIGERSGLAGWVTPAGGRMIVSNCTMLGGVGFDNRLEDVRDVSLQIHRTTIVATYALPFGIFRLPGAKTPPMRLEVSECVFDSPLGVLMSRQRPELLRHRVPLSHEDTSALLPRLLDWRGDHNLYPEDGLLAIAIGLESPRVSEPPIDLGRWRALWDSAEAGSVQGQPRFQGGDLTARVKQAWDQLTPADFRLLPGSPGKGAGQEGRDLGADVDRVGPGAPYERWKTTPEYRRWQESTRPAT